MRLRIRADLYRKNGSFRFGRLRYFWPLMEFDRIPLGIVLEELADHIIDGSSFCEELAHRRAPFTIDKQMPNWTAARHRWL